MIQEIERTIAKREQIAVRYKAKSEAVAGRVTKARGGMIAPSGDGALGELTTTALKKKVRQFLPTTPFQVLGRGWPALGCTSVFVHGVGGWLFLPCDSSTCQRPPTFSRHTITMALDTRHLSYRGGPEVHC